MVILGVLIFDGTHLNFSKYWRPTDYSPYKCIFVLTYLSVIVLKQYFPHLHKSILPDTYAFTGTLCL